MFKRLFIIAALLSMVATVVARPVDKSTAMRVASTYLQSVTGTTAPELSDITAQTPFQEFYTFTLAGGKGFILVAADDCVLPVLGYSEDKEFVTDEIPSHVLEWLQMYDSQIAFYREHYGELPYGGLTEILYQWETLSNGRSLSPENTSVSPMLTTTWAQHPYYNNLCPYDSQESERTVTGCVATAMAQIMKYHNHPSTGYGYNSYSHPLYGTQSANFGSSTYSWSNMPNSLSSSSSTTQVNAVATLMYHVGVAVNMNYGITSVGGSGAATVSNGISKRASAENALVANFKYKNSLHGIHKADFTDAEWCAMLRSDLDAGHPILYSGSDPTGGHAFVLDGYNNQGQFHINWGWGGNFDGHYTMGDLHPGSGGTGGNSSYTFNLNNSAIIGIEPNNNWNTSASSSVSVSSLQPSLGTAMGSGSYSFGDTIQVYVMTEEGVSFKKWSDGNTDNPRDIFAHGGNINLTATVAPLSGDTLGYGSASSLGTYGMGDQYSDCYWGICLPGSLFTTSRQLSAVQLYVSYSGTYDVSIYTGNNNPTTLISTQTYNLSNVNQWNTLQLNTPVTVNAMQNIWIIIHNYGIAYPAALTSWGGNNDCFWFGSSMSDIYPSGAYSSMVRGVFGNHGGTVDPEGERIPIGDINSTANNYTLPVNTYYNYTMTQTIIDADELGGPMDITGISYKYAYTQPLSSSKNHWMIWIKPTNKSSFSSGSDRELVDNEAVLVFNSTVSAIQGWNDLAFSTPYHYDGTGNLMIIVTDTAMGYDGSSYKFYTSDCSGAKSLSWYSDSYKPSVTGGTFAGTQTTYNYRPVMQLIATTPCTPVEAEIGDINSTSSAYTIPFNTYYNYSLTETIIDADEIGGPMNIGSIFYKYAYTTATNASNYNIRIWLKPTTKSAFSSDNDIELVDGNATLVFDGSFSCQQGWNEIPLDTRYSYDGSSNLVVIVCDDGNGYDGSNYKFNTASCTGDKTLTWYSDSYVPSPTSSSFSGSKGRLQYRPVMKLAGCAVESEEVDSLTVIMSLNDPTMGTISPAPGTYRYGEGDSFVLSATPNAGYQVKCWVLTVEGISDTLFSTGPLTIVVTEELLGITANVMVCFGPEEVQTADLIVTVDNSMGNVYFNGEAMPGNVYHGTVGEFVTLNAIANEGYKFKGWSDGSTEAAHTVELSEPVNHLTAYFEIDDVGIGSQLPTANNQISIFPNPTDGSVTIDAEDVIKVEVWDLNGRKVAVVETLKQSIDLSNLSAGTYLLRIITHSGTTVRRLVKK